MILQIDSREKLPLEFEVNGNVSRIETVGLLFGDYQAMLEDGSQIPISFDRKTPQDLYATLTSGNERFKREVERARKHNFTLYLIIEGSLSEIASGVGYSKVEPDTLIKTLFTFKVKYGVEPIFCNNRAEMKRYIIETFESFARNWRKK